MKKRIIIGFVLLVAGSISKAEVGFSVSFGTYHYTPCESVNLPVVVSEPQVDPVYTIVNVAEPTFFPGVVDSRIPIYSSYQPIYSSAIPCPPVRTRFPRAIAAHPYRRQPVCLYYDQTYRASPSQSSSGYGSVGVVFHKW